jgi:5-formyltetrahydrofolate cyclo-ligase
VFDSFGLGEWGIVAVVAVLFVDPKKLAVAGRTFARFRKKWNDIQREVKQQFDSLTLEEDLKENLTSIRMAKAALRREAREALKTLPSGERAEAAEKILTRIKEWPVFQQANIVAAFAGTLDEVDTENLLRHILASGKILLLPYLASAADGTSRMMMVPIQNYDQDLREGTFGILEPREELRNAILGAGTSATATSTAETGAVSNLEPDLVLIPGLAFDERGGRIGKGRGFYDRYLDGKIAFKAGVAFEAQVLRKKLALEPHDQFLDGLVTEQRLRNFSLPQSPAPLNPTG